MKWLELFVQVCFQYPTNALLHHSHELTHVPPLPDTGITCDELDRIVHEATIARNAYPSPLNYHQFPKSFCTSVNEVSVMMVVESPGTLLIVWCVCVVR